MEGFERAVSIRLSRGKADLLRLPIGAIAIDSRRLHA